MNNPIKQHYVQKMLLKRFAINNMIYVYDRKNVSNKFKYLNINIVAFKKNLYTYTDDNGRTQYDAEKYFSDIEGLTNDILDKIENKKVISIDEKNTLSFFIAYQILRTPYFFNFAEKIFNKNQIEITLNVISSTIKN